MTQQATTLLLVAGGKGTRMGSAIPKQFLPLAGKPVLYYSIKTFTEVFPDIRIILVLPEEHLSYGNILLQAFESGIDLTIVKGGDTRFHSVRNGLQAITGECIVFIHDGVRPFVSQELIKKCYVQAIETGNAIPAIQVSDSIRQWNGFGYVAIDRTLLKSIQTPQTFRSDIIIKAYQQDYNELFTDEATVAEVFGIDICLVEGLKENIKITTPEDFVFAEARIKGLQT